MRGFAAPFRTAQSGRPVRQALRRSQQKGIYEESMMPSA
jgi:hypothetical protein